MNLCDSSVHMVSCLDPGTSDSLGLLLRCTGSTCSQGDDGPCRAERNYLALSHLYIMLGFFNRDYAGCIPGLYKVSGFLILTQTSARFQPLLIVESFLGWFLVSYNNAGA